MHKLSNASVVFIVPAGEALGNIVASHSCTGEAIWSFSRRLDRSGDDEEYFQVAPPEQE